MSEKIMNSITLDEIKELAETVRKNELGKIKIRYGECEIVIEGKKSREVISSVPVQPAMTVQNVNASVPSEKAEKSEKPEIKGNTVKAPIVGTFYASPSPEKPPFVKIGDTVKKGDVIMIIESMKLMNEVQSDFDGKILDILVENGQAVEYDQPIMIIG